MHQRTAIFSICSNNYVPQAEILFESARLHHPEADLFLGLADESTAEVDYPADVRILPADQLRIPDFRSVAFSYDIMEFNTAIKPFVALALVRLGYTEVVYFDPDIMIFRRLDSVFEALAAGASFVLTPHLCSPPGTDAPRSELDIMRTGIYNLGFLACSQQAETEPILRWWARKLRYECVNDQTGGLFVDQKFMDLVPGFTEGTNILRDTAMNVAYWNLAQRRLEREGDTWTVDGRPLGFFHFSGFDPTQPERLSKHIGPWQVSGALRSLLMLYAERLLAKKGRNAPAYAYAKFDSGTPIPDLARRMFRERHLTWSADPFSTYEEYLRLPSSNAVHGRSGEIVTNLMHYVWERSPELRSTYALHDRLQVSTYARWFAEHASELGIAEPLR